jgi:hypothetical protein
MKGVLLPVLLSTLGLAGCVAVPMVDAPYGYGPAVVVAPPPIVVRPGFYGHGGGYYGRGGYYGGGPRRGYYR